MSPRVSIITATYNAEAFIGRTIDCVLGQSFTDFEWIVVDDGSADATVDRVAALDDPRVALMRRPNGGPSAARNTGLARARGGIVALLDHDDVWTLDRLERLVQVLDGDEAIGFASSNMFVGDPDRPDGALTILDTPDCRGLGLDDPRTWLHGCSFSPSTAVVRTELLHRHGGWDERLWYAQDWELVLRLWLRGERAAMLPKPLGWTVMRPGQLSASGRGTFRDRAAVLQEIERTSRDPRLVELARSRRLSWELDEARRSLGSAMLLWPTDPKTAREEARWAVRRPLAVVERVLAAAFALSPTLAGSFSRLARRASRRHGTAA